MSNKTITIGVDIGGAHVFSAAFDTIEQKIITDSRSYTKINSKGSVAEIMQEWGDALRKTISKIDVRRLKGIAFAIPGPFDYKKGIAKFEKNDKYERLKNVDIGNEIAKMNGIPKVPIRFINDATAFAIGVSSYGEGKPYKKVVALTLGTGIGSAFIENGTPVFSGPNVPCLGCLWHLRYRDGMVDDYFSTRWLVNEFKNKTSRTVKGVHEIANLVNEVPEAKIVFDEFGLYLGEFLAPWLKQFSADVLILGGGITKSFKLFSPILKNTLIESGVQVDLKVSGQMEDATIMASAKLFEESFWDRIKGDLPDN
ncbi:MAG: ROK family protein [Flavobacteriaceae bacterium]